MSDDPKCVAGCIAFYGGERKHHKDCPYYSESLTKVNADRIEQLREALNGHSSVSDRLAKKLQETELKLAVTTEALSVILEYDTHVMYDFQTSESTGEIHLGRCAEIANDVLTKIQQTS